MPVNCVCPSGFVHKKQANFQTLDYLLDSQLPAWPDKFGKALRSWFSSKEHKPIRTLSLFSGIGGLDIAFQDSGFQIVEMIEVNAACITTLKDNVRSLELLNGSEPIKRDIKEYYPDRSLNVDFIIGGPPCQPFSAAGRRMNGVSGLDVESGKMFEHYVRILKTLQPKGFVFENVTGLLGAQGGNAWEEIKKGFAQAGYHMFTRVLDAADYGVPQHRERIIIIGLRDNPNFFFPAPTHHFGLDNNRPHYSAGLAVSGIETEEESSRWALGKYGHLLSGIPPGLNYSFYTQKMGHPQPVFSWRSKFSDFLYKADPNTPTRTIKASGGHFTGPFHWDNRPFTVDELKRIQTIPDEYNLTSVRVTALRQIGNAVPPQMGRILALSILDQVYNASIPIKLDYINDNNGLQLNRRKQAKSTAYLQKAEAGIKALEIEPCLKEVLTRTLYTRFLHQNFGWSDESQTNGTKFRIRYINKSDKWVVRIGRGFIDGRKILYRINLKPTHISGPWVLRTQSVELQATDGSIQTFTASWKAFEELLNTNNKLADLVQLSGYYQYPSSFKISIKLSRKAIPTSNFYVLKQVLLNKGVGSILSVDQLAKTWKVETTSIDDSISLLRELGYEVRSHNTNKQIPRYHYLIPYSFPTLTPKSVQLFKNVHSAEQEKLMDKSLLESMIVIPT